MKKTELELEHKCCNYARRAGIAAVKLEKNAHRGIPDRVFIGKGGKSLYVEFKRPDGGGVFSPEQKFWKNYLEDSHALIDNFDDFVIILSRFFELI